MPFPGIKLSPQFLSKAPRADCYRQESQCQGRRHRRNCKQRSILPPWSGPSIDVSLQGNRARARAHTLNYLAYPCICLLNTDFPQNRFTKIKAHSRNKLEACNVFVTKLVWSRNLSKRMKSRAKSSLKVLSKQEWGAGSKWGHSQMSSPALGTQNHCLSPMLKRKFPEVRQTQGFGMDSLLAAISPPV